MTARIARFSIVLVHQVGYQHREELNKVTNEEELAAMSEEKATPIFLNFQIR